jgi:hypothetical protein
VDAVGAAFISAGNDESVSGKGIPFRGVLKILDSPMIPEQFSAEPFRRCSIESVVRRLLSIFLVLLTGFGPLTVALAASGESRLPECCRRQGAHHCAMSETAMARSLEAGSAPVFAPPPHCPQYPRTTAQITAPVAGIVPAQSRPASRRECTYRFFAGMPVALAGAAETHDSRGPPAIPPRFI